MIRAAIALGLFPGYVRPAPRMRRPPPPRRARSPTSIFVSQDLGDVTITCSGLSEAFGRQLADILTRVLQDRLDPQMVMGKLDEVDQVPQEGIARTVSEDQRQLIIHSLSGKPAGQIAITAHPEVADSADFAKGIATSLLRAGWAIEGQEIRRVALTSLDPVPGLAIVVRDKDTPPANGAAGQGGAGCGAYYRGAGVGSGSGAPTPPFSGSAAARNPSPTETAT